MNLGRAVLAPLVVAPLLAMAGCGGGSDTGGTASAPSSPADAGSSATASAPPTVAPATGLLMDVGFVRLHAPRGWVKTESSLTTARNAADKRPGPTAGCYVSVAAMHLGLITREPIQKQAREALEGNSDNYQKIAGYPHYAGRQWYHLTGASLGKHHDYFGRDEASKPKFTTFITVDCPLTVPAARRQPIIDSVMASVEFEK